MKRFVYIEEYSIFGILIDLEVSLWRKDFMSKLELDRDCFVNYGKEIGFCF